MATRKEKFVNQAQVMASKWAEFAEENRRLLSLWNAEQYDPNATEANPITDEDCAAAGTDLTAARVNSMMTQVYSFVNTWYTSAVEGEIQKARRV
jgi:hypothetical protein